MPREQRLHLDLSKGQAKGLKLEQEVTLTVTGKIVSLSAPDEFVPFDDEPKEERFPAIALTVKKIKVAKRNVFSELSEDDDEDSE